MNAVQLVLSLKGERSPAAPVSWKNTRQSSYPNIQEVCDCCVPNECAEC